MADEIRAFAATIPAGTPQSAPVTIPTIFPERIVDRIDVKVPAGPSGLMGFQIVSSGTAIIPANAGGWLVWDNRDEGWDLTTPITSGDWYVVGYNTGRLPHTVYVEYSLSLVRLAVPAVMPLLPNDVLSS